MPGRDIIVVGASAGGTEALQTLVSGLPPDLPAAVFVVMHIAPEGRSFLPAILSRRGPLPASHAVDGQAIRHGCIYIAPPDHHLVLERGYMRVTHGPKENRFRPAVDVLFRSAAYVYGTCVIGVILTGQLNDGTAGLWAVKDRGGLAVVQEPQDAFYPSMPQSALRHVAVDYRLPIDEIAPTLARLTGEPAPAEGDYPVSKALEVETRIANEDHPMAAGVMQLGQLSPYTCPECHGVLLQLQEGGLLRFRCHTGHAFSASSLLAEVTASIERLLSSTVRALEESMLLLQHLARHTDEYSDRATAAYIQQKVQQAERRAALLRQAARGHEQLSAASLRGEPEAD